MYRLGHDPIRYKLMGHDPIRYKFMGHDFIANGVPTLFSKPNSRTSQVLPSKLQFFKDHCNTKLNYYKTMSNTSMVYAHPAILPIFIP